MAGKYHLFLVLWFVVGCLAAAVDVTDAPGSTSVAPTEAPVSTSVAPTAAPVSTSVAPTAAPGSTSVAPTEAPVSTSVAPTAAPGSTSVAPTAAPGSTSVAPTAAPGSTSVAPTAAPGSTSVAPTAAPGSTSVAPTAATGSTSVAPTAATGSTSVAPTAAPGSTSVAPTAATGSTPVPPTAEPDPCQPNPCGRGSTCAVRANQTFVCLCSTGDNYNYDSQVCVKAKVFPGQLSLPKLTYKESFENTQSPEFKEAAQSITNEVSKRFNPDKDGFSDVLVLSLQRSSPSRVGSVRNGGVNASIEIIFSASSTITTSEVTSVVKDAVQCEGCLLAGGAFKETDLCAAEPCDELTTTCSTVDGRFYCNCTETYVKTNFSDTMCIACPDGQYAVGSSSCEACNFGYSGLNCKEHWKLALVIVGSVLGGLLLITLILLPILALRSSKKKSKHEDIGKPYVSHFPAKSPMANGNGSYANSQMPSHHGSGYEGAGVPKIPRATTNSNWDRRTNLEMTPSNSRQNLVPMGSNSRLYDDEDDMNSYTRPQSNLYAPAPARPQSNLYAPTPARPQSNLYAPTPARPQSNPYAQSRPQSNPYASNQGQNNPYYQQR
ncbi:mucin-13b [Platichthys flesus]|uniref:mucin-13b n=1 Tax=Platichthys flesus TaxID=8260 RepID=UPI002DBF5607|nr:mucin-13b [Platichthys flesus]